MRAKGGATASSLAEAVTVRRTPSLGALSPPLCPLGGSGHVMGKPVAEGRHSFFSLHYKFIGIDQAH